MEMNYEMLDKKSGDISYKSDISDIKYAIFFAKRKISFKKSKYVLCTAYSLYCTTRLFECKGSGVDFCGIFLITTLGQ